MEWFCNSVRGSFERLELGRRATAWLRTGLMKRDACGRRCEVYAFVARRMFGVVMLPRGVVTVHVALLALLEEMLEEMLVTGVPVCRLRPFLRASSRTPQTNW